MTFLLRVHIDSWTLCSVDFLKPAGSTNVNLIERAIVLPRKPIDEAVHIHAKIEPASSPESLTTYLHEKGFSLGFDGYMRENDSPFGLRLPTNYFGAVCDYYLQSESSAWLNEQLQVQVLLCQVQVELLLARKHQSVGGTLHVECIAYNQPLPYL